MIALEIDEDSAKFATENVQANYLNEKILVLRQDTDSSSIFAKLFETYPQPKTFCESLQ